MGGGEGRRHLPSNPLPPVPSFSASTFARLYNFISYFVNTKETKKTPKKAPATQAKGAGEGQLKGVRIRARVRGTLYVKFCHLYTAGKLQSKPGSDLQSRKGESLVGHV